MNLVVASNRSPVLFVAQDDHVTVYDTPTAHGQAEPVVMRRRLERPYPDDDSEGYLSKQNVPVSIPFQALHSPVPWLVSSGKC